MLTRTMLFCSGFTTVGIILFLTLTLRPQTSIIEIPLEDYGLTIRGEFSTPSELKHSFLAIIIPGTGNHQFTFDGSNSYQILSRQLAANGIANILLDKTSYKENGEREPSVQHSVDYVTALIDKIKGDSAIGNFSKIGIIGHSSGGLIGALVSEETDISFLVCIATPLLKGETFLNNRLDELLKSSKSDGYNGRRAREALDFIVETVLKTPAEDIPASFPDKSLPLVFDGTFRPPSEREWKELHGLYTSLFFKDFVTLDITIPLSRIRCPTCFVLGTKDPITTYSTNYLIAQQVTRNIVSGKVISILDANHFMQIDEHSNKGRPFGEAPKMISEWLKSIY